MFASTTRYTTRYHQRWTSRSYSAPVGASSTRKTESDSGTDSTSEIRIHAKNLLHSLQNYFSRNSHLVDSSRVLRRLLFTLPQNVYANLTDPNKFTISEKSTAYYWTNTCNSATSAILFMTVFTGGVSIIYKIPAAYFLVALLNIEYRNIHPPNENSAWAAAVVLALIFPIFAYITADAHIENETQTAPNVVPAESKPHANTVKVIYRPKDRN